MIAERLKVEPEYSDLADQFVEQRIRAERMSRRNASHGETTFDAIYEQLAISLGLTLDRCERMKAMELKTELDVSIPIMSTIAEIRLLLEQGMRVVLISDMYHSADFIRSLLHQCCPDIASRCKLYVSSEHLKTKGSGALFHHVSEVEKAPLSRLSHSGDHPQSDVMVPRRIGARGTVRSEGVLRSWEKPAVERSVRCQILSGRARQYRLQGKSLQAQIGYSIAAPIFAGYVAWVLRESEAAGIGTLGFLARDGYLLSRVAEKLQEAGLGQGISIEYVYSSRAVWRLAATTSETYESTLNWALLTEKETTVEGVMTRLGLTSSDLPSADPFVVEMSRADAWRLAPLTSKRQAALKRVLLRQEMAEKSLAAAAKQRDLLLRYLQDKGMLSTQRTGIVDVGWKGSSQAALARILGEDRPINGFYICLASMGKRVSASPMQAFCGPPDQAHFNDAWIGKWAPMVEILATAPHGSLNEYSEDEQGNVIPVLDEQGLAITAWGYDDLVQGCLDSVRENGELFQQESFRTDSIESLRQFTNLLESPWLDKEFAECIGRFPFSPDSGSRTVGEIGPIISLRNAVAFLFGNQRTRNEITIWPNGAGIRSGRAARLVLSGNTAGGLHSLFLIARGRIDLLVPLPIKRYLMQKLPLPVIRFIERLLLGKVVSG
ncbi:hypothetical protein M4951_14425 [Blastopirellula sp. J2-11]|uniref:hypothetical protein n=1 Tax=Blastopirellula sp. J2-11 TaxID=2943192 RepID=UPI0021C8A305|nr:hypothetical protein [Blastopirellula sp. J2-11]UUO04586.1 hypothetical protein M4951_14425 [Blastopirellula sp. J2-11]